MGRMHGAVHLAGAVDALAAVAIGRGVPDAIVDRAAEATRRRFVTERGVTRRRIEGYFWAVVRRRSLRSVAARDVSDRLVLDSIAADLRAMGRTDHAVVAELERGWRGRVADHVLDEYCAGLCA